MDDDNELIPSDGLSNYWIEFEGIDCHTKHSDIRFRIFHQERDGSKRFMAALSFPVHGSNEFYEMVALGHDALIQFLRQALFVSNNLRTSYRKSAQKMSQEE